MRPSTRILVHSAAIAAMLVLATGSASAQVGNHVPGTICFTERFWCWAQPPGPPGAVCVCPSPFGFIRGTLG